MLIPSVSGDIYQKSRAEMTHCIPWFRLHLILHSTDTNRACAASTRFYQVTSLVTNPTIVAAIVHILMPKRGGRCCVPRRYRVREIPPLKLKGSRSVAGPWNASARCVYLQQYSC